MDDATGPAGIGSGAERMAQLVVEFTVPNLEAALQFYTRVGFTLERRDGAFAVLSWGGERQLFLDEDPRLGAMPHMYANVRVIVPDVDAVRAKIQELEAAVVQEIGDRRYGLRDFTVADPAGFGVRFATPIRS